MQLDLLAASDGGPKKTIETVAVARLAHSRFNTRRSREAADVEALAERIARNGFEITRAPWAYPANGGFEVFAGGTRYEAARKAAVAEIPIVVHRGFTDDQIARLADEDNENDEYHRPVGVLDVWAEYHRLWKEEGWTQQRIADAKGVQRDLVTRRCGWHEDLCEAARAAVCNGTFDEGHAKAVSEVCVTLHTDALSPWLTTTAAQTEFVAALLKSAKKKDGKPSVSVKDVRAAAQPWKDTIAAAQDGWTELAASDDADDDGKKYAERWQTAFVEVQGPRCSGGQGSALRGS
jgi:ParB-like chromosome segregation protein Spo0J